MAGLRRARDIACAAALLLGACNAPAVASLQNENLLVPLPQGYKLGWQTPDGHWQEFIHPPETVDTWSTMITVQIFHGRGNADPAAFADQMARSWKSACADASAQTVRNASENGYPVAVRLFICPLNAATHKPETMWLKAIGGTDSLYVAQYAARQPPSKELVAPAMEFLRQVMTCDTRRADHPCPMRD